jgi:hypothetical protein
MAELPKDRDPYGVLGLLLFLAACRTIDNPVVALDVGDVAKTVVCDLAEQLSLAGVSVEIGR